MAKLTLILGASENGARYSNIAIHSLRSNNHDVIAVGFREGKVLDVNILDHFPENVTVHTVAIYLSASRQRQYYKPIIALSPERVIFPPGAENEEFERQLQDEGIEVLRACTMVMLSTGEY